MSEKAMVKVGIAGLGTVGSGTFNILDKNFDRLSEKLGMQIYVSHVGARREHPDVDFKHCQFSSDLKVSKDIFELVKDDQLDIVVELIGGIDTAFELVKQSLLAGKHVVTANKALIAEKGRELFEIANANKRVLAFEGAVAGGIPVIKALNEGLIANEIEWLAGIINGTGNFILTEMKDKGRDFDSVLKEAQKLGYAEADPSFDIEGTDAAHKLAILASLAFSVPIEFEKVYVEGITAIEPMDLMFAENFGYKIKHLGIARKTEKGIEARVHPTLVPSDNLIAKVDGVMNAIMVKGDAVGSTMYYGPGAGAGATGSAVCADIIDIAVGNSNKTLPLQEHKLDIVGIEAVKTAYYLRVHVKDEAGVLAALSKVLSEQNINIEGLYQQELPEDDTTVPVVIITQRVLEADMNVAIEQIEKLDASIGIVKKIRIEHFKS